MKKNGLFYITLKGCICLSSLCINNLNGTTYTVPIGDNIQTYINMATQPGDIVQLQTGTYPDQWLHISTSGISLQGTGIGSSIIQSAPQSTFQGGINTYTTNGETFTAFILVENATDVTISNLTADGNDAGVPGGSGDVFQGIGYYNAGGTIENVYVTHVTDGPGDGDQHLYAIAGITDTSPMTPYIFNVTNCTIDFYQKNAIEGIGNNLIVNLANNTITGPPSAYSHANPNGIELLNQVSGTISGNNISNVIDYQNVSSSVGLFLYQTGSFTVQNNQVYNNDIGVYIYAATGPITVSDNNIYNNNTNLNQGGGLGLYVGDTTGTTLIQGNTLSNNVVANMQIQEDSMTPSNQLYQLENNKYIDGAVGLQVYGFNSSGPVITFNGESFTGTSQYYVQEELPPNAPPNNIWPYLGPVYYDGLVPGQITYAQYEQIRTKIYDKLSPVIDPALGLVLDYYAQEAPLPPSNFIGHLKKNKFLNRTEYILHASWTPPPSGYAVLYRVYKNGVLYAEVPSGAPLVFDTCLNSESSASKFTVTSVNVLDIQSSAVPIVIVN